MKIIHIITAVIGLSVTWALFWPSEKDFLNAQMAELCKKDGGVKVYEQVMRPAGSRNNQGILRSKEHKLNDGVYVTKIADSYELFMYPGVVLIEGDPLKGEGRLSRYHSKLVRISDRKVLAEIVNYHRAGGDRWFAGMPSSSTCGIDTDFLQKVFVV